MPENIEKNYELRDLQADDLFVLVSIVSKIGIKEFKACFASDDVKAAVKSMARKDEKEEAADNSNDITTSVGISVALDIASILMANIGRCKSDIYALLSNLSGMKAADIAKLPVMTFTSMVVDLVKKKEFADFFQEAVKLFK